MLLLASPAAAVQADVQPPVYVGLDAEFGVTNATSAQSIERGIRVALEEINRAGGVLGGRRLELVTRDNRSVPARAIANLRDLATVPDLVAVFNGRYSPVVLQTIPVVHELGIILLDPWAAANAITDNGHVPNYVFRLSLRDNYAMRTMLGAARQRGRQKVGLILPTTGWGRSNQEAARQVLATMATPVSVGERWYSWGASSLLSQYRELAAAGAEAIILVANDVEGGILVREVAALPEAERLPIICHWGVTGGQFFAATASSLNQLDFTVVQTFSLFRAEPARVEQVLAITHRLFGLSRIEDIEAPVGFGQAYDLTHLLARAIGQAGTTDRAAVRDALEHLGPYQGLVRTYERPFTPDRHDALDADDVFMARFRADGAIVAADPAPDARPLP